MTTRTTNRRILPALAAIGAALLAAFDWEIDGGEHGIAASVLCTMPFTVNSSSFASASLSLNWASDDRPLNAVQADDGQPADVSDGAAGVRLAAGALQSAGPVDAGDWFSSCQSEVAYEVRGLTLGAEFSVLPAPSAAVLLGVAGVAAKRRARAAITAIHAAATSG